MAEPMSSHRESSSETEWVPPKPESILTNHLVLHNSKLILKPKAYQYLQYSSALEHQISDRRPDRKAATQ